MRDDDHLPPGLERATELLRDETVVRPAWRASVMAGLDRDEPVPSILPVRRWSMRPTAAIAAAILCATAGGALTFALTRTSQPSRADLVAAATESATTSVSPARLSRVRFTLVAPNAARVSIVGDFNQWNPATLPMRRSPDGQTWEIEVPLASGRYTYAFFVDGRVARDTAAAENANDGFGTRSSVVLVRGGGT
jgi:hypothetical protein